MPATQVINLLIVDDEPDLVSSLQRILKARGFSIETACSGEEAVVCATNHTPDGILMDIKMPAMDGVEAVRQIRSVCPDAFVIFMTGYSELVKEAEAHGPVAVLSKPVDPKEVCDLLDGASGASSPS